MHKIHKFNGKGVKHAFSRLLVYPCHFFTYIINNKTLMSIIVKIEKEQEALRK